MGSAPHDWPCVRASAFSVSEFVAAVKASGYDAWRAAKRLGVSPGAVSPKLRRAGLRLRPIFCLHTPAEMRAIAGRYQTAAEASRALGVDPRAIRKGFSMHGVEYPWPYENRYKLRRMGVEAVRDICRSSNGLLDAVGRLGVDRRVLTDFTKRHGIEIGRFRRVPYTPESLRQLYVVEGYGCKRIARAYGCNQSSIHAALVRFGIPTRGDGFMETANASPIAPRNRGAFVPSEPPTVPPTETTEKSDSAFVTEPRHMEPA